MELIGSYRNEIEEKSQSINEPRGGVRKQRSRVVGWPRSHPLVTETGVQRDVGPGSYISATHASRERGESGMALQRVSWRKGSLQRDLQLCWRCREADPSMGNSVSFCDCVVLLVGWTWLGLSRCELCGIKSTSSSCDKPDWTRMGVAREDGRSISRHIELSGQKKHVLGMSALAADHD